MWALRRFSMPSQNQRDGGELPPTLHQIDAIHKARDSGESVLSIVRRFEVSRMTV